MTDYKFLQYSLRVFCVLFFQSELIFASEVQIPLKSAWVPVEYRSDSTKSTKADYFSSTVIIPSTLEHSEYKFIKLKFAHYYKFQDILINGVSCLNSYSNELFVSGDHIFIPEGLIRWDSENQIVAGVLATPKNLAIRKEDFSFTAVSFADKHRVSFSSSVPGFVVNDSIFFSYKSTPLEKKTTKKLKLIVSVFSDTLRNTKRVEIYRDSIFYQSSDTFQTKIFTGKSLLGGSGYFTIGSTLTDVFNGDTLYKKKINFLIKGEPGYTVFQPREPDDWNLFWDKAISELSLVTPNFSIVEEMSSSENHHTYKISYQSIGNQTIYGWYTLPKNAKKPLPVMVIFPGYMQALKPAYNFSDVAVVSIHVRGHGESKSSGNFSFPGFFTAGLHSPETYVFRGVIMDTYRAIDFIKTRPELDSNKIVAAGSSQGGYLALCVSGLRNDIFYTVSCMAPFANYREYFRRVVWPGNEFIDWASKNKVSQNAMHRTLSYFDANHFTSHIQNRVYFYAGLQDEITPAFPIERMARIRTKNSGYFLFEKSAHNVPFWNEPVTDMRKYLFGVD